MELGRVITPEAVREALDLARDEFFAENDPAGEDAVKFMAATEYAAFSGRMLAGNCVIWACRDGGRLRGMLALEDARDILLFFVARDYRRHGIGRALVAAACEYAQEAERTELRAAVPESCEAFFLRLGFERKGGVCERGGIRGADMRFDVTL